MDKIRLGSVEEGTKKQLIFDLMNGLYDLEKVDFPESRIVENEFAEGKPCEELYRRVYDARIRICERLGVSENLDVETIISCMEDISCILAMKMFDYATNKELVD